MIPQVVDEPRQQGSRTINLSHLKVGLINVNGLTREKSAILAEDQQEMGRLVYYRNLVL